MSGRRHTGPRRNDQLVKILRDQWTQQVDERAKARQLWVDEGWVFASRRGQPLNTNTDDREWKSPLADAGVRGGRLHDARHTAATVVLLLGVPERAVMDVMGWSSSAMVKRYQHITAPVRSDIAARVGGLIWESPATATASDDDEPDGGAAGVPVPT
jgi:integrase